MNGRTLRQVARSVQLAVMATPETSIVDAVVEARRRHASDSAKASVRWSPTTVRPAAATA